jgi:hypothetical protein
VIFFYIVSEDESEKKLIAWCELVGCETLDRLITEVQEAARTDKDVCQVMLAQAKQRFGLWIPGIEPDATGDLIPKEVMDALVRDTFYYFAHPAIGNIGRLRINAAGRQIPLPRAVDLRLPAERQPRPVWADCTDLLSPTRTAIETLIKSEDFARFDSMARDQVRVVHNTRQLARAIFGEICCTATKRLEKILALRLCGSQQLFVKLNTLLQRFMGKWFSRMPKNRLRFEYTLYYFAILEPQLLQAEANNYRSYFLRALACTCDIEIAGLSNPLTAVQERTSSLKGEMPTRAEIEQIEGNIVKTWLHLPPVIRCIILINDFRVLWENDVDTVCAGVQQRISTVTIVGNNERRKNGDLEWSILRKAFVKDEIIAEFEGLPYLYSWNRDEETNSTCAYRNNLCPLWAGPSAHVTKLLAFWEAADRNDLYSPPVTFDSAALATALFAFWRLYYDKRVSAAHVFVETVEQTYIWLWEKLEENLPGFAESTLFELEIEASSIRDMSDNRDIFEDVMTCCEARKEIKQPGKRPLNPFTVLSLLEKSYLTAAAQEGAKTAGAKYDWLLTKIGTLRSGLEGRGYFVPQWTWDFTTNSGLAVRRVEMLHAEIRTSLQGVLENPDVLALIASLVGNQAPPPSRTGTEPGPVEARP